MGLSEFFGLAMHTASSAKPEVEPSGSDDSPETKKLLLSIRNRAHAIACNVRQNGQQPYGPMWAQGHTELPDGRTAFLQQSQDKSYQEEVLGIDIPPSSDFRYNVDIRYNLKQNVIDSYEVRRKDRSPVIVYDRMDPKRLDPACLMLCDITRSVDEILETVRVASDNIEWKKPEPAFASIPIHISPRPVSVTVFESASAYDI